LIVRGLMKKDKINLRSEMTKPTFEEPSHRSPE
jgi:hypothetical protein